jgi:hypothetical protein
MTDDATDTTDEPTQDSDTDDDRPRCGSTDTETGNPCRRVVSGPSEQCFMHSGDGPPDDHGAPPPALQGNTNAVSDAAYTSVERRLETFDADQMALFEAYFRDFARKAENRLSAVQLATAAVVRDSIEERLLTDGVYEERALTTDDGTVIHDPGTGDPMTREAIRSRDIRAYTDILRELRLGKKYEGINDNQQNAAAAHGHGNISLLWGDPPDDGVRTDADGG